MGDERLSTPKPITITEDLMLRINNVLKAGRLDAIKLSQDYPSIKAEAIIKRNPKMFIDGSNIFIKSREVICRISSSDKQLLESMVGNNKIAEQNNVYVSDIFAEDLLEIRNNKRKGNSTKKLDLF